MVHLIARLVLVFVLLWCLLSEDSAVQASLPVATNGKVVHEEEHTHSPVSHQVHHQQNRLPGVCRRLRRRRITVLCNVIKYCSVSLGIKPGHLCRCPKGSRCSHFFLKSLL